MKAPPLFQDLLVQPKEVTAHDERDFLDGVASAHQPLTQMRKFAGCFQPDWNPRSWRAS